LNIIIACHSLLTNQISKKRKA